MQANRIGRERRVACQSPSTRVDRRQPTVTRGGSQAVEEFWAPIIEAYEREALLWRRSHEPGGVGGRPLMLPLPVYRALVKGGIATIDRLAGMSDREILKVRGIGPVGLRTIRGRLVDRIPVATAQQVAALRRAHRVDPEELR
jgi:hypothetical protein